MDENVRRVVVIVLSYGYVVCGMVDVVNILLGINFVVGIEMLLDESFRSLFKRIIEVVKKVYEGKGCLLLVDMGFLVIFGEIIIKEIGILISVIGRVDIVMVFEVVRRVLIVNSNFYEIVKVFDGDKVYVGKV